jgi:alpha-galactosidase
MYYAFFAPSAKPWKGKIELRGLGAGKYRIIDYANGRDLGTMVVENGKPLKLTTEFKDDLLLEVNK